MLNLILFGPPGSGKGTQAPMLVEKYGLVHISTGDLFRSEIGNKTSLGLEAKSYIDKGNLVPDELTIRMLKAEMERNPNAKGFIFDGFPRTIPQAQALDAMLLQKGSEIALLAALDVPDEELVTRLFGRSKVSGRSDDGDEQIVRNRLHVYKSETLAVASHYELTGKSRFIVGVGTVDEIFERLCREIDAVLV